MRTLDKKAMNELVRRAEQGNASAQCNLGVLYGNGQGVPRDYAEAANWFQLAADQGNAPAQCNLGALYRDGHGVRQDYEEAANWFRLAADQGVGPAQFNLGLLYLNGRGVPQDYAESCKWLNLAITRTTGESQAKYAEVRDKLLTKMTPQQIDDAQHLARAWKPNGTDVRSTKRRATARVSG